MLNQKQKGEKMKTQLSTLEDVDIRNIWENESLDFTPWLAQADNIDHIGQAIGIDLTVEEQEKSVGPYRADIFCKDEAENPVLIENQLENTDHKHLGQLLTYATGLDAVTSIWIASQFSDEHRATLDWLNEHTDQGINFFGIQVEVKKGNGFYYPFFKVISQPNNWSKSINTDGYKTYGKLTDTKKKQQDFWEFLKNRIIEKKLNSIKPHTPRACHWLNFAIGSTGTHMSATVDTNNETMSIGIRIRSDKDLFHKLKDIKDEVEQEFGGRFKWFTKEDKKCSNIRYYKENFNIDDKESWKEYSDWMIENLQKLQKVFSDRVKLLKSSNNTQSIN